MALRRSGAILMADSDTDRVLREREYRRVPITVPLLVSYGSRIFQKQVRLQSKNVSGGGLAFETRRMIPPEANARVLLSGLGDLPAEARIEGRVVYRMKNASTGKHVIGIVFTRFVDVSREDLLKHIERWEAEEQLTPS